MASGTGSTASVAGRLAVCGEFRESDTLRVNAPVPTAVGVPEMTLPFSTSPAGSFPELTLQV
jgi:hypothetical protein